ncbi:MAG: pirin family protein [Nitriliruptor sp.]|nr:MAG: pirin family protein [Nitriliruptor sp.]
MSGPVQPPDTECEDEPLARVEAREGRSTEVGGLPVARVLPTKGRRTVGAWCFVDLLGPMDAVDPDPLEVGPHPHIGLSTVTWLLEGEAIHTDSLGTEQAIRPGQLNLMTAGHGIAHAELAADPPFRGVQLWVAQPEQTRHDQARFEHLDDLPQLELDHADALVFVGALPGATSPARTDTELLGVDLQLRRGTTVVPTDPGYELAVVPLEGRLKVGEAIVEPGWIGLVPTGVDELPLEAEHDHGRALVLGGTPLGERIQMWWNFVARDRDELSDAYRQWRDRTDRFAAVPSRLERIEAPVPPWLAAED